MDDQTGQVPRKSSNGRFTLSKALTRPGLFRVWERMGFHLTPVHFYQPIPDTRDLSDDLWSRRSAPAGVEVDLDAMRDLIDGFRRDFGPEFDALPRQEQSPNGFFLENGRYETVDAEVCHSFVRSRKPKRIIEVGSGFSTILMLDALARNEQEGRAGELVTIDPYPFERLHGVHAKNFRVEKIPVQRAPLSHFESLESGDILFIDSSHVSCIGSDVTFEILEILPRIKPGVLVHIHDIFLPAEYPKKWVMQWHRFWNEQYMLQAFLAFNSSFRVAMANHWMHLERPDALKRCFPSYDPQRAAPGSIWIERVA
ncbi:MAG: class I SAM-dependent methyltransferase [Phycisphaerales bacterium]